MPQRIGTPCRAFGCGAIVNDGTGYCRKHSHLKNKELRKLREKYKSRKQKIYSDRSWRKARKAFLKQYPLCAHCLEFGYVIPATVVDHIVPHRGNMILFWDRNNWQPLCIKCHSRKTLEEINKRK